jgi:hypothetical protein
MKLIHREHLLPEKPPLAIDRRVRLSRPDQRAIEDAPLSLKWTTLSIYFALAEPLSFAGR